MKREGMPLGDWSPDFALLPMALCAQRGVARAVDASGAAFLVCAADADPAACLWAQHPGPVLPVQPVPRDAFDAWVQAWASQAQALQGLGASALGEAGGQAATAHARAEDLSLEQLDLTTSPVIKLVNATLHDALKLGASDVHVETTPQGLKLKFRIDGVLRVMSEVRDPVRAEQVLSRIKVMAELDISERRVPQDGRLQVQHHGRAIDVRVSVMPSVHGEDAVLRILDRQHLVEQFQDLTLQALGLPPALCDKVLALARRPHGMVLVTGPTGSGKTTTLYAAVNQSCSAEEKVITIEDPVEYHLEGVLQIPVNERKGLTFARGLRSILRHDPDKILVGEIRDAETAQIAVQAALTGHLVLTTVHANDVFDVLGRFQQFDIDPYSFVSALNGILAQRLMRRACPQCAAAGCPACGGTGYKGRFAVGELLPMSARMKSLIAQRAPYEAVHQAAREEGLVSLREQALAAARAGVTTQEEADRVTAAD